MTCPVIEIGQGVMPTDYYFVEEQSGKSTVASMDSPPVEGEPPITRVFGLSKGGSFEIVSYLTPLMIDCLLVPSGSITVRRIF